MLSLLRVSLSDMLAALHGFSSVPSSIACLQGDIPCAEEQYHFLPRIAEEAGYSHH